MNTAQNLKKQVCIKAKVFWTFDSEYHDEFIFYQWWMGELTYQEEANKRAKELMEYYKRTSSYYRTDEVRVLEVTEEMVDENCNTQSVKILYKA